MCVVWPGRVKAETSSAFELMSMDILPTLLDAAEVAVPSELDGRSFLPTLMGDVQPALRTQWLFTRREGGLRYGGKTIEAIREADWKLLQNSPYEPLELYNMATDPYEQNNLAVENPAIVNRLDAALRLHLQRGGVIPWQPSASDSDD